MDKTEKKIDKARREYLVGHLIIALKYSKDKDIKAFYTQEKKRALDNFDKILTVNEEKAYDIDSKKRAKKNEKSQKRK